MSLAPRFDEFSTCGLVHRAAPIFAQTDDDAISFYRSLGFVDSPTPRDARWPVGHLHGISLPAPHTP